MPKKFLFVLFVIIPASFVYFSQFLGYSTTNKTLTSELIKMRTSEHFIIHYSPRINEKMMDVILLHHEYYYLQLKDFFNIDFKERLNPLSSITQIKKRNYLVPEMPMLQNHGNIASLQLMIAITFL